MITKVKTFLHVLSGSIVPQTPYYGHILKSRFLFSLTYFLILLSIITTVTFFLAFVKMNRNNVQTIRHCLDYSLNKIPSNLIIEIKNNRLYTNHELPLFVWLNCQNKIRLLAVIDERANKEDIDSYGAQLLITGSQIVAKYRSFTYSTPLSKYVSYVHMDKEDILFYLNSWFDILSGHVLFFVVSLAMLTIIVTYLINGIYIILSSILVKVFYAFIKKRYSIKKIVQIGFHSSSTPLFISLLFMIFPIHILNALFLHFSLIIVFQLVAVYEAHYGYKTIHHHLTSHKRS